MDPCPFANNSKLPTQVICGNGYSGVVTQCGAVYTWGSGEFGRLGY
jgi:alpha-tubulin suppressor-like RCC1 family protein